MIRRSPLFDAFEREQIRSSPPDHARNLQLVEALFDEARELGVIPLADPLEGIDVDVRYAKAIGVHRAP